MIKIANLFFNIIKESKKVFSDMAYTMKLIKMMDQIPRSSIEEIQELAESVNNIKL